MAGISVIALGVYRTAPTQATAPRQIECTMRNYLAAVNWYGMRTLLARNQDGADELAMIALCVIRCLHLYLFRKSFHEKADPCQEFFLFFPRLF